MIKLLYLLNVVLMILLGFSFKNLFSKNKSDSQQIIKSKKTIVKKITKEKLQKRYNNFKTLSATDAINLVTRAPQIFDYARVYPGVAKNSNNGGKFQNNQMFDMELKKFKLVGIFCYGKTKKVLITDGHITQIVKRSYPSTRYRKTTTRKKTKTTIKPPQNSTKSYQENDTLGNGFKILKIEKNSVVVVKNNYKGTLKIDSRIK